MADIPNKKYFKLTTYAASAPSYPQTSEEPVNPLNPDGMGNGGPVKHNSTLEKQGGNPALDEFYHLTEAQFSAIGGAGRGIIRATGVAIFGGATAAGASAVNITAAKGYIHDGETNPLTPVTQYVEYAGGASVPVTTIGTGTRSYALLKIDGTIHFQNTFPTSAQRKEMIYLFKVGHPAGVITIVANEPDFVLSPLAQFRDLFQAFNYINGGVYPYPSSPSLAFGTTGAYIVGNGINFVADDENPNNQPVAATNPTSFVYRSRTGAGGGAVTAINPNIWDNAGALIPVGGGANSATIQRLFYAPNAGFIIQPGQTVYSSLENAIAAVGKDQFVIFDNLVRDSLLIGVFVLTRSATNLQDTANARILKADIFGQLVGSAAGISTYVHPPYAPVNQTLTGPTVLASFKSDAIGSVTEVTTRAMTKTDIGLGNVDNTSDADKPISDAAQDALDDKASIVYVDAELAKKVNYEDLEPVSFYLPLLWVMDGVTTVLPIPDGGEENWLLSKVNRVTTGVNHIEMAFEFYPDTREIRIRDGYSFDEGQEILFDLIFIYN